jgi:hypothetical protein
MHKTASDLLIGDLLRGAGLVTLPDLTNAVQVASKTGLPVGRVLVMLGLVGPEVVQAASQAQSLIRENCINLDAGKKALCMVSASRISLDDALRNLGLMGSTETANKLGSLLLAGELITQGQLADALNTSQHLGLPLGRILVLKGTLSEDQVQAALEAQILMRDGRLVREDAVHALKAMRHCGWDIKETLEQLGFDVCPKRNVIRLGELVMLADLVSETDLLTAIEIGLVEGVQIGQVLIDFGFIDNEILDAALRLQMTVTNNHLTPGQAGEALRLVTHCKLTLVQAIADVMEPQLQAEEVVSLLHLLQLAGLITTDQHERLIMFKDTSIFETVLIGTGLMNETTLEIAIRCHILMKESLLTCEQAVVALHHWRWTGVDLADIFHAMGWTAGAQPAVVPGIYKWDSEGVAQVEGASPLQWPFQNAQVTANQALTASMSNADLAVTQSVANYEWGNPGINTTLH